MKNLLTQEQITVAELAKFLNVSASHVYQMVRKDAIPYHKKWMKKSTRLYFNGPEIEAWIESCKARPTKPLTAAMIEAARSEQQTELEIQSKGLEAPRLDPQIINEIIDSYTFTMLPSGKCMVCEITLKNGFIVTGESIVVSKENFDREIGEKISLKKARDKVWGLEAYILQEIVYQSNQQLKDGSAE